MVCDDRAQVHGERAAQKDGRVHSPDDYTEAATVCGLDRRLAQQRAVEGDFVCAARLGLGDDFGGGHERARPTATEERGCANLRVEPLDLAERVVLEALDDDALCEAVLAHQSDDGARQLRAA